MAWDPRFNEVGSIGTRQRAPGQKNKQPERSYQIRVNTLLEWLIKPGIPWTAVGHGGGGKKRGRILKRMGVKRGWSDFQIYFDRTLFLLELKSETGALSQDQKNVRDMVLAQGGKFASFRDGKDDLDAVEAQIRAWGIPCNAVRLSPAERLSGFRG